MAATAEYLLFLFTPSFQLKIYGSKEPHIELPKENKLSQLVLLRRYAQYNGTHTRTQFRWLRTLDRIKCINRSREAATTTETTNKNKNKVKETTKYRMKNNIKTKGIDIHTPFFVIHTPFFCFFSVKNVCISLLKDKKGVWITKKGVRLCIPKN